MNRKLLGSLLLIIPFMAVAEDSPFSSTQKGIQIVPMGKQELPAALKAEIIASKKEESEKGYITTNALNPCSSRSILSASPGVR